VPRSSVVLSYSVIFFRLINVICEGFPKPNKEPVAYLECVKGGGPGGLGTEVPQWGPGAKPR